MKGYKTTHIIMDLTLRQLMQSALETMKSMMKHEVREQSSINAYPNKFIGRVKEDLDPIYFHFGADF